MRPVKRWCIYVDPLFLTINDQKSICYASRPLNSNVCKGFIGSYEVARLN
jgi:hypothetical protein